MVLAKGDEVMQQRDADKERQKLRFRVIKTYPENDKTVTCVYEGTRREFCVELSEYIGGKTTCYRRVLEKWLRDYECNHSDEGIKFVVELLDKKKLREIHRMERVGVHAN